LAAPFGRYLRTDKQARATELVLEQAEVLSKLWAIA
jgi:hypothetical protein